MPAKNPKEYAAAHYKAHKVKYKTACQRHRRRNRDFIIAIKKRNECAHCGCNDHRCLCFHHKDPATKLHRIYYMHNRSFSLAKIQAEIDKCIVLCANCHAIEHYKE
jgi:hypothetical protein